MKYRKTIILEDNGIDIRNIKNISELAKKIGVDRPWLSKILKGTEIASEELYLRLKQIIN
jgi:transcriptional regulator with XRE-family HTH domain